MNSYNYLFKFIVIGDTGVGKSCIVLQFIENKIRSVHDVTIGVQFGAKTVPIKDKLIKLQIWDTAGQQNFRSITRSYYRSAIGALLVYDVTRRDSFTQLQSWLQQVKANGNQHIQILLVGNKNDMQDERAVSAEQGEQMAKKHKISFIQINAMQYHKVEAAFKKVAQKILQGIQHKKIPLNQNIGIKKGGQLGDQSVQIEGGNQRSWRCC